MNTAPTPIPILSPFMPAVLPSPAIVEGDAPRADSYAILFQVLLGLQAATPADPSAPLPAMDDANASDGNAPFDQTASLTPFVPQVIVAEGTPLGNSVAAWQTAFLVDAKGVVPAQVGSDGASAVASETERQPDAVASIVTTQGTAPAVPELPALMISIADPAAATAVDAITTPDVSTDGADPQLASAILPGTDQQVLDPLVAAAPPQSAPSNDVIRDSSNVDASMAAFQLSVASMVLEPAATVPVDQQSFPSPMTSDEAQRPNSSRNAPSAPSVAALSRPADRVSVSQPVDAEVSGAPSVTPSDQASAIATVAQIIADLPADAQFRISIKMATVPKPAAPVLSTAATNDSEASLVSSSKPTQESMPAPAYMTSPDPVAPFASANAAHGEVLKALPVPVAAPRAKIGDATNVATRRSEPVETSADAAPISEWNASKPAPSADTYERDYDVTATQTLTGRSNSVAEPSGVAPVLAHEPSAQPVLDARAADAQLATAKSDESATAPAVSRVIVETPRPLTIPGQITVRLEPPQLGRMRVDLSTSPTGVIGRLRFQSDTARTAVQSDLGSLRQALADAGVRVDRLEVTAAPSADNGTKTTLERHAPSAWTDRSPSGRGSDKGQSNSPWREDRPRKERQNPYGAPAARSPWGTYPMNALAVNMVA